MEILFTNSIQMSTPKKSKYLMYNNFCKNHQLLSHHQMQLYMKMRWIWMKYQIYILENFEWTFLNMIEIKDQFSKDRKFKVPYNNMFFFPLTLCVILDHRFSKLLEQFLKVILIVCNNDVFGVINSSSHFVVFWSCWCSICGIMVLKTICYFRTFEDDITFSYEFIFLIKHMYTTKSYSTLCIRGLFFRFFALIWSCIDSFIKTCSLDR